MNTQGHEMPIQFAHAKVDKRLKIINQKTSEWDKFLPMEGENYG